MALASFRSCPFAKKFSLFEKFAPSCSWWCQGAPALVRERAGPPSSPGHATSSQASAHCSDKPHTVHPV